MNYLYILTEDDNDDIFYEGCVTKITGDSYEAVSRRLRKGSGISAVRGSIRFMIRDIRRTGSVESTYFVVAMDNDRAPEHPEHTQLSGLSKSDESKSCRYCEMLRAIEDELGPERDAWPIQGAIAVPVQMLESWLLLICGHSAGTLPLFAKKSQDLARQFYASQAPPDQLKDLCNLERQNRGALSMGEFCLECALDLLDPEVLARKSPSFAQLKEQIEKW
ncbi:hypothetical protein KFU94_52965 [Chloroflexi bacterium TSY]|nr:hypothetical protein [Chloroflexi bacterium TSY]